MSRERKQTLRYSSEQKREAVDYYFHHGQCLARTIRELGYPSPDVLRAWIDEVRPGWRQRASGKAGSTAASPQLKRQAVIELCSRSVAASVDAEEMGVSRQVLYKWRNQLLGEEVRPPTKRRKAH